MKLSAAIDRKIEENKDTHAVNVNYYNTLQDILMRVYRKICSDIFIEVSCELTPSQKQKKGL